MKSKTRIEKLESKNLRQKVWFAPESTVLQELFGLQMGEGFWTYLPTEKEVLS